MIFSLRFARITVHIIANFVWGDLDEMIDFFSGRKWLGMGPFLILTNIDGGDVEEICHFQIEKLRSHGNIFHIIANFVWGRS